MHLVGLMLLLAAIVSVRFAVREWRQSRVLQTPFWRTGDIARRGLTDEAGNVSCEGMIQRCAPAIAPCSGMPCAYYEVESFAGTTRLFLERGGERFQIDDGTGPIEVDPCAGMDVELVTSFDGLDDRGVHVIERIVPMEGRLYVLGRLGRERVLEGPLVASRRGRKPLAFPAEGGVLAGIVGAFLLFPALALLVMF